VNARNQLDELRRRALPARPGQDPSGQYL
jgi:hypothetical protein